MVYVFRAVYVWRYSKWSCFLKVWPLFHVKYSIKLVCLFFLPLQYSLVNEPLIELTNPGASGSLFYLTSDDEFIIKTVQHKEAKFLQRLLPGYYMVRHLQVLHEVSSTRWGGKTPPLNVKWVSKILLVLHLNRSLIWCLNSINAMQWMCIVISSSCRAPSDCTVSQSRG